MADVHYACDFEWWKAHPEALALPGLKIAGDRKATKLWRDVQSVAPVIGKNEIIMTPGRVGWGGNSGFQALNLAVQFGARDIVLIGYDMSGNHWHGRHRGLLRNPDSGVLHRWAARFDQVAPQLAGLGVRVRNASRESAIRAFPKVSLAEALS